MPVFAHSFVLRRSYLGDHVLSKAEHGSAYVTVHDQVKESIIDMQSNRHPFSVYAELPAGLILTFTCFLSPSWRMPVKYITTTLLRS
jgi:hypothetical protein